MKVKLNDNIYKQVKHLNEIAPAPNDATKNASTMTQDEKKNNEAKFHDAYASQCKQMFINKRKQDALLIDIKMPSDIGMPLKIDKAPEDLGNLMRALETGGKFLNINNMVEDPQKTFDHASDFAANCFSNLKGMEIAKKEYQKNTDNVYHEAYLYDGVYGQLNEADLGGLDSPKLVNQTAIHAGWKTGMVGGNLINGGMQALTHVIGGVLVQTSFTAALLFGLGYFGSLALGHSDELKGANNNSDLIKDNIETEDNSNTASDMNWKGDNAIEAINAYIKDLKESVANVIAQVSANPGEYNKFVDEIDTYLHTEDEALASYFKLTDDIVNKARKQEEEDYLRHKQIEDRNNKERADFGENLSKLIRPNMSEEDIDKYHRVLADYRVHCSDGGYKVRIAYEDALKTGDIQKVFDVFDENGGKKSKKMGFELASAIYDGNGNVLNEEAETIKKPEADVTSIYNTVNGKLSKLMNAMFPLGSGDKMPGIKTMEELMDGRIKVAGETIKNQINQVCSTLNKGQDTKLGDKIKGFFMSHPLQAERLTELWAAHEAELKMRKARRIKQMTDYGNTERIIGWTAKFCKNVVPELFARLFAYRYLLTILKRDGYYNYTPARYKDDVADWETVGDSEMKKIEVLTEWILGHYGSDYTVDEKPYIDYDDQGIKLVNPMNYASLMLMRVKGDKFNVTNTDDLMAAHQIAGNNEEDKIMDFIMSISGALTPDPADIATSVNKFRITEDLKKTKTVIRDAYNQLISLKTDVATDNINMTQAWNLLAGNPEIFKKYRENYKSVDEIIGRYKGTIDAVGKAGGKIEGELKKKMQDAEREIKSILGDFTYDNPAPVELDFTKMLTVPEHDNSRIDYYAYIASFYYGLMKNDANNIAIGDVESADAVKPDGITKVCMDTYLMIKLISSGIFTLCDGMHPMTKNDLELYTIQKALNGYTDEPENDKKVGTLEYVYVQAGGSTDQFENTYKLIEETLKQKSEKDADLTMTNNDIYNEIMHLLEDTTDAANITDDIKNNLSKLFTKPGVLSDFTSLKIPDIVNDCKDVKSLMAFAKLNMNCQFNDTVDEAAQTQFLDSLKGTLRYLIEYVLSTHCSADVVNDNNDAVSILVNSVIKETKADNPNVKAIYEYCKDGSDIDAYLNAVKNIDSAALYAKFKEAVTTGNIVNNACAAEKTSSFDTTVTDDIKNKGNYAIDYRKYIKDCKSDCFTDLIAAEIPEGSYKVECDDADKTKFADNFKQLILRLIAYTIDETARAANIDNIKSKIDEKIIYGMTIAEYANFIFGTMQKFSDMCSKTNEQKFKTFIGYVNTVLNKMNNEYCEQYNSINNGDNKDYKLTHESNIDLKAYDRNTAFTGLFKVLDGFSKASKNPINNIESLYEYFNGIQFEGKSFKELPDKVDAMMNLIKVFKMINDDNQPNAFSTYKTAIQ